MKQIIMCTKNKSLTILMMVAFGLCLSNLAFASTLNISGSCVDDDFRISKNGSVVYDGVNVLDCGPVTTNIDASCDDKIKLEIKDNAVIEVGFNTITLTHDGYSKSINTFLYQGSWIPGQSSYALNHSGRPKQAESHYPSVRYYSTEIDGTKTLRELGLCAPEVITCSSSSQCGASGYIGSPFCQNGNVYQKYVTYTCNNAGTASSTCTSSTTDQLKTICNGIQTCNGGTCVDQNIDCSSASDCGTSGYTGSAFCSGGDVYKTYRTYTCNNAGTASSYCSNSSDDRLVTDCSSNQTCSGGSCVNQNIACDSASDCGTNAYTGSPFCQGNSIYRNYTTYTCHNAGTASSYCSNSSDAQLQSSCTSTQTCNSGSCTTNQSNIVLSCYATPNPANTNQTVSFICNATGGTGYYTYSWSGACASSSSVCTSSFYNSGIQTATAYVTSGSQSNSATVSVNINSACTQNSYQRCSGSYLYWYDSCGVQGGLSQYCPNGCYNNACQNYNNTTSSLNVNRTVKNLTTGSGWATSVSASPSDMLMFMTTVQASGTDAQNVVVRDTLPSGLIYNNQLIVSGTSGNYNYSGTPTTGLYLNTIPAGQTVTITYQAQVADSGNFSYGSTTLNANSSVTSSNGSNPTANSSVIVTKAAVYGASTISTGLTNNILVDSFFLPALITLLGVWMWKAGMFFGIERWISNKRKAKNAYNSDKELADRIATIQETETI